ncbi:MAG: phosphoribosylglycinamide formyltransferase [Planctomycetota bacterium]
MTRPAPPHFTRPTPTAVLASGGGRTFENLVELAHGDELPLDVRLLVSDRASAGALERARRLDVEALCLPWPRGTDPGDWSREAFAELERRGIELVLLGGFLRLLHVPPAFAGRVLNIHPSLLPAFGGAGFYGTRVHRAVLERGVRVTGCTVHLVDARYDEGPILHQEAVRVLPDDDPDSLAARVFEAECRAYPAAIRAWLG